MAVASVSKLVTIEELAALGRTYREEKRTLALTNGCFDGGLHSGHLLCIEQASKLADVLIVALNSDASVRQLKGPSRPVIGERDRARMLAGLACVTHVVIFDAPTPCTLLRQLRPEVLVKGGTYAVDEVVGKDVVEAYGGKVCVTGYQPGVSTTAILQSIGRSTSRPPGPAPAAGGPLHEQPVPSAGSIAPFIQPT